MAKTTNGKKQTKKLTGKEKALQEAQEIRKIQKEFQDAYEKEQAIHKENEERQEKIKDYLFKMILKNNFDFTNQITRGACIAFITYTKVLSQFTNEGEVQISPLEIEKMEKCFREIIEEKVLSNSETKILKDKVAVQHKVENIAVVETAPHPQQQIINPIHNNESENKTNMNEQHIDTSPSTEVKTPSEISEGEHSAYETNETYPNDVVDFPTNRNNEEEFKNSNLYTPL